MIVWARMQSLFRFRSVRKMTSWELIRLVGDGVQHYYKDEKGEDIEITEIPDDLKDVAE